MAERVSTIARPVSWKIPQEFEGIMSYNPRHDIQDFLDLSRLQGQIPPEEFAQKQSQVVNRTEKQLIKAIGERFHVRSSSIDYFLENGVLRSEDYGEPVIKRYRKGQTFLKENGSIETDREEAEIDGLQCLQHILLKLKANEKVIIVSPVGLEGTLYKDNFFDVYEKRGNLIVMTRYHSTHNYEGFLQAATETNPEFPEPINQELGAAFFLRQPIVTTLSTSEILETFALDSDTQSKRYNQKIIEACFPYFHYYIDILINNPLDFNEIEKRINAIYNIADETDQISRRQSNTGKSTGEISWLPPTPTRAPSVMDIRQNVAYYGVQPVRPVAHGCPGGQNGFSVNQSIDLFNLARSIGAQSVLDFAPFSTAESEEVVDFQCPGTMDDGTKCTYIIKAYSGESECPQCGEKAVCTR